MKMIVNMNKDEVMSGLELVKKTDLASYTDTEKYLSTFNQIAEKLNNHSANLGQTTSYTKANLYQDANSGDCTVVIEIDSAYSVETLKLAVKIVDVISPIMSAVSSLVNLIKDQHLGMIERIKTLCKAHEEKFETYQYAIYNFHPYNTDEAIDYDIHILCKRDVDTRKISLCACVYDEDMVSAREAHHFAREMSTNGTIAMIEEEKHLFDKSLNAKKAKKLLHQIKRSNSSYAICGLEEWL